MRRRVVMMRVRWRSRRLEEGCGAMGAGHAEDHEDAAREEGGQDAGGELTAAHMVHAHGREEIMKSARDRGAAARFCCGWWCRRGSKRP